MLSKLAEIKKFLVSALGMLLTILAATNKIPFLPPEWHVGATAVAAVLTPILTWLVKNKDKEPSL
jgi:hypothetical protein